MLIVPQLPEADRRSWARIVDLVHGELPALDVSQITPAPVSVEADPGNEQTVDGFAAERTRIAAVSVPLTWIRPSDHDPDRMAAVDALALEPRDAPETEVPVGAGQLRGLILHKLMEETITGELEQDAPRFARRAGELLRELTAAASEDERLPDAGEMAATALRTLQLPEIAELRGRLVAEWPVSVVSLTRFSLTVLSCF